MDEGERERLRARVIREAPEPPRKVTLWELSPCSRAGTGQRSRGAPLPSPERRGSTHCPSSVPTSKPLGLHGAWSSFILLPFSL